ncbi:MAG: hypothetical protein C4287_20965 [Leptolyngbya sp. ERB_1_2]
MSGIETIKDLSFYLKDFVLNLESDHPEFALLKKVFKRQRRIQKLCEFEYIVGYEWAHREFNPIKQAIETHRGDLVLMNESGNFLVVELKSIQPEPDFDHRMRRAQRLRSRPNREVSINVSTTLFLGTRGGACPHQLRQLSRWSQETTSADERNSMREHVADHTQLRVRFKIKDCCV